MRSFSGKRFYNLVKTTVLLITIPAALAAAFSFYRINYDDGRPLGRMYSEKKENCDEAVGEGNEDWRIRRRLWCTDYAMGETYLFWDKVWSTSSKIALILLGLFYGGTYLYKYLFPERKEADDEDKERLRE